jgi:hypothetical protein
MVEPRVGERSGLSPSARAFWCCSSAGHLNAFNTQLPAPATTQQIVTGLSIVAFALRCGSDSLVRNVLALCRPARSVMGHACEPDALGRSSGQPGSHCLDVCFSYLLTEPSTGGFHPVT